MKGLLVAICVFCLVGSVVLAKENKKEEEVCIEASRVQDCALCCISKGFNRFNAKDFPTTKKCICHTEEIKTNPQPSKTPHLSA